MRANWRLTVLGAAAPLVLPALALAAPRTLRVGLDYDDRAAPSDCPTERELRGAIARQLGYDPFAEEGELRELVVHVEMQRSGTGTEAHIEWLSTGGALEGERRLASENDQCSEIASGVVFAVAVQLELRAASTPAPPPPPPRRAPAPRAEPPPKARSNDARAVLVGGGAFLQHGVQPDAAAGFRTFGALRGRWWSLGLEAHGTLPTTWRTSEGAGFSANMLGLGLSPCLRAALLDICLLGNVGQLSVRGEGVDRVRSPSAALAGVGLRLQVAWPELERLAALVHVEAWAPLTPREVLVNRENVWATAPVAFAAGLDMAVIFR